MAISLTVPILCTRKIHRSSKVGGAKKENDRPLLHVAPGIELMVNVE